MEHTYLEPGIAQTRGLKENIFMVAMCCLADVPLMIVGPPGSSKTLAVTVVAENAKGSYSRSAFYKAVPSLLPFHYQCSRRSTSNEIRAVFESAIKRQAATDREQGELKCFVFMDEAGLPEEERESLKVLHYYLENHMSVEARVGFVAITNHLLDAAKSNRCALLTRAKPDHEELMNVARGCLGTDEERSELQCTVPGTSTRGRPTVLKLDPSVVDDDVEIGLLDVLCETYDACMNETPRPRALQGEPPPPVDFVTFFGLRDFMHFIKLLGRLARADSSGRPTITRAKIEEALERNMNGVVPEDLTELIHYFMFPFPEGQLGPPASLRNPLLLMHDSIDEQAGAPTPISRYKMVIDTTADDSILRALVREFAGAKVLKLSDFAEDNNVQQVNLISQVKWNAESGKVVKTLDARATITDLIASDDGKRLAAGTTSGNILIWQP